MDIQIFPQSQPVSIESRQLFSLAYRNTPPAVADQVFSNLFGWQEFFNYRFSRYKDFLLIFSVQKEEMVFLPPLLLAGSMTDPLWGAKFADVCMHIVRCCRESGCTVVFRAFPNTYTRHLSSDLFTITAERDSFDYVYRRSNLADLSGRQYAAKRNLIKQFSRQYSYRFETLSKDNLACVYRFVRRWKPDGETSVVSREVASGEYGMVNRLMKHFDEMRLWGGLLFVDGKEIAATVASLVPDFMYDDGVFPTAIVHSEHALVEYKGAYQIINQLFSASLPEDIVFVNREEDLGIAGLRKAKLSYGPERLVCKSRIELKKFSGTPTNRRCDT